AATAANLAFHHSHAAALLLAGRAQQAQLDLGAAKRAYFEALREIKLAMQDALLPAVLEAIAGTHPDAPVAARLLGKATALRDVCNLPVFSSDHERPIETVRVMHGDTFEREFAAGRSITRDDAIA